jgi:hypothetical protein
MRVITSSAFAVALLAVSKHARSEEVLSTTECEIIANPPAFNHRLVRDTGTDYQAFEKFPLSVESCGARKVGNWTGIWVEYGGRVRTIWIRMCRMNSLSLFGEIGSIEIEGVQTALVENDQFRAFDLNVQRKGHASATLIGRYFSGGKAVESSRD